MKKWFNSPGMLFGLLQIVAVLAILGGLWLSLHYSVQPTVAEIILSVADTALWTTAWGSFLGMCRRLAHGGTAFTQANSCTLRTIGLCILGMATLVCARGTAGLIHGVTLFGVIEAIVLPGTFLTVAMLAFILRRLLDNAMALEEAQADVV